MIIGLNILDSIVTKIALSLGALISIKEAKDNETLIRFVGLLASGFSLGSAVLSAMVFMMEENYNENILLIISFMLLLVTLLILGLGHRFYQREELKDTYGKYTELLLVGPPFSAYLIVFTSVLPYPTELGVAVTDFFSSIFQVLSILTFIIFIILFIVKYGKNYLKGNLS